MNSGYYDVDSILSEDTLVPTTLPCGISDLGKVIDPSTSQADVAPGSHVSLPLWIADPLQQHGMAEVEAPTVYSERHRRKMEAGAECVNLRIRAPYFYTVGLKYNDMQNDPELLQYMFQAFRDRYQKLLLLAFSPYDTSKMLQLRNKLSQEELHMFEAGRTAMLAADEWRDNTDNSISTNKGKASRKRRAVVEAAHLRNKENINPAAGKDKH